MVEIEFSIMVGSPGGANHISPLLEEFRKQHGIRVNMTEVLWNNGWAEISKFGIYGHGPDVSCVGTTWIGSLASMQALRPYDDHEIRVVGGGDAFFESIWRTGFLHNDPILWSVPWLGDAMLLYYWEKHLKKAGISDFEAAFATDAALAETLEKLQRSGVEYPLAINVKSDSTILHEAAHWVWNAGGDFVSADGRQVVFDQPAAIPGITFTGGCGLVIWQYTLHPNEAFELVRFLATQPVHPPKSIYDHRVPTRREALHMPLMENDDYHRAYLQAIQRGRGFPTMRLWGAIEDKLRAALGNIWRDLFANPDQDLDVCIHKHLDPIAARLNMTLGS